MKLTTLFSPMKIGSCEIPNRTVVPAMVSNMCPDNGKASEQYIRYHEEKAKGGWGLIITENYRVNPTAGGYPYICGLWDESQIESHKRFTDTIHQYQSKIFCQIYHAGRQANHLVNGGVQPVSCSPIADAWNKEIPHELTTEEVEQIVADFGRTARNCKNAGFDGIEIHAAHGYLIHQFLSPNCNHRIDKYGGSYDNRVRILKEVMSACRAAVGPDFPIIVRISAEENSEGGRRFHETRMILKQLEEWGADAIHLSTGMYGVFSSVGIVASHFQHHGWTQDFAAEAKKLVNIPIITVGRIAEPRMAEDILESGKADFIAMGRESLTDPHWPNKAKEGRYNDIRHCIGCLQGCTASTYQGVPLNCVINPELGHEFEYDYTKVKNPKTIYIAGAGIAGMEAARAAAIKGHNVELFEAKDTVGGQFVSAAYPPYKGDYANYTGWLYREIQKYDNIRLHLHTELTREMVLEGKPDKIIVATGAAGIVPKIPGIENPKVVMAEDALLGRKEVGMNVLIAGGGMVGLETAAFFGMQCKSKVTVIEMKEAVATDMEAGIRDDLKTTLRHLFVEILCNTSIAGITDEGALIKQGNDIRLYPCDTVIMAIGTRSNQSLLDELRDCGIEIVVVGDAVKARQITQASREGFVAGLNA